jgi:hypothetical protein
MISTKPSNSFVGAGGTRTPVIVSNLSTGVVRQSDPARFIAAPLYSVLFEDRFDFLIHHVEGEHGLVVQGIIAAGNSRREFAVDLIHTDLLKADEIEKRNRRWMVGRDCEKLVGNFQVVLPVCTENLSSGVVVVKSAKDGV